MTITCDIHEIQIPKDTKVKLVESTYVKGAYKVWFNVPGLGSGFLRIGHAWKTKTGALKAAQKSFPGVEIES